jgi:hypothetical protein
MDARAKQRLCLERRPLLFTLSLAVSPRVISVVERLLIKLNAPMTNRLVETSVQN